MNHTVPNDTREDSRLYTQELQRYLQTIQRHENGLTTVTADGFYDPDTTEAVKRFQQQNNLPVTGEADFETWHAICSHAKNVVSYQSFPVPVEAYRPYQVPIVIGDASSCVAILQIMLRQLSSRYDNMPPIDPPTGVYTANTVNAVRFVQALVGIPESEAVDQPTWNAIALLYNESP